VIRTLAEESRVNYSGIGVILHLLDYQMSGDFAE